MLVTIRKSAKKSSFFYFIACLLFLGSFSLKAFESFEHLSAGRGVHLPFPGGHEQKQDKDNDRYYKYSKVIKEYSKKTGKLAPVHANYVFVKSYDGSKSLKYGYGEIVALAGDYFGLLNQPISFDFPFDEWNKNRQKMKLNFSNAFSTLRPNEGNPFLANNNLRYLRGLFEKEYEHLVVVLTKEGGVQLNLANSHTVKSKINSQLKYSKSYGYSELLTINMDHFALDAKKSYLAGHLLAFSKAKEAHGKWSEGKEEEAIELLNLAYAYNAFASHYFSDLFSAGHLRTPRRELYEMELSDPGHILRGLMANAEHDEDGYLGLWVASDERRDEPWKCFGDASYFDRKSEDNRENLREALQMSVDEIFEVFESGVIPAVEEIKSLSLLPSHILPSVENPVEELGNHFPLFVIKDKDSDKKTAEVRKSYYDISADDYVPVTGFTGLSSFLKNDQYSYNHSNFYSLLLEEDFVGNYKKDAKIACYNNYDRNAWTRYTSGGMAKLDAHVEVIVVDNRVMNFYPTALEGTLNPKGIFFVVSMDEGDRLIKECEKVMSVFYEVGKVTSSEVVEVRGEAKGNGDHPIVVYTEDGKLRRLRGHPRTVEEDEKEKG